MSWTGFLEGAPPAEHAVQCYRHLDELALSVGRFLDAGFRAGEPAVVIACADHRQVFRQELERDGHDVAELEESGLLTRCDADETLAALLDGELPSADRFEEVVGGTVDAVALRFPGRTIRAVGEMVDILARRGLQAVATELEELWNGLLRTRGIALLCAYELDVFDLRTQTTALPDIVRTHTHQRPVADPARLAAAVHATLTDVSAPTLPPASTCGSRRRCRAPACPARRQCSCGSAATSRRRPSASCTAHACATPGPRSATR